jgi:hypothetical protein
MVNYPTLIKVVSFALQRLCENCSFKTEKGKLWHIPKYIREGAAWLSKMYCFFPVK